jgi:hypothetical protein
MKMSKTKSNNKKALLAVLVILLTSSVFAQNNFSNTTAKDKNAVGNLINGIKSDNEGLKRSCIYFAGKYKVAKTVDALIEELEDAETTESKYLISLSLYLIGDSRGIEAVRKVAATDQNPRTRNLVSAVYKAHVNNQNLDLAVKLVPQQ